MGFLPNSNPTTDNGKHDLGQTKMIRPRPYGKSKKVSEVGKIKFIAFRGIF